MIVTHWCGRDEGLEDATLLGVAVSALAAATAVAVVRFARHETGPSTGWDVLVAFVTFAGALSVQMVTYQPTPPANGFGLVRIGYLHATVGLPIVALALLLVTVVALVRGKPPAFSTFVVMWILILAVVAPPALGWYATYVEPFALDVERVAVVLPADRPGSGTVNVGVVADIQADEVSQYHYDAFKAVMDEQPDIIVIAGDLYEGSAEGFESTVGQFQELLTVLRAPYGVYFVEGDIDHLARMKRMAAGTEVRILFNETVTIAVRDRTITIGGVANLASEASSAIVTDLQQAPGNDTRILLTHRPDRILGLVSDSRVDLVIAGHTQGGQVQLPFICPIITKSEVSRHIAAGGLHTDRGNQVYVSTGIGWKHAGAPRIRLGAPPSVGLLELWGSADYSVRSAAEDSGPAVTAASTASATVVWM